MEIIVEYALLDNLVIDSVIISLVYKLKKDKICFWRMFVASLFGSICAILMPLLECPNWMIVLVKMFVGVGMVLIAFKTTSFKKFILDYFLFMSSTFVLGGIGSAVLFLFFGEIKIGNGFAISSPFPMSVIYIAMLSWVVLFSSAIKYFYKRKNKFQYVYDIEIENAGKVIEIKAYLDSGNTLIDPTTNKPVIIVGYKTFCKLHKVDLQSLLMKKMEDINITGAHYVEYSTVQNQKSSMLVFPIEKIRIKDKSSKLEIKESVFGLSFVKFQKNFGCDVLLNQNCF